MPRQKVRVNESCSASVKTDLLRRLRRLNQSQRRATRVEPAAQCSYGMCLLPLAGPPRGLLGTATADRPALAAARGGRGWGKKIKGQREGGDAVQSRAGSRQGGGSFVFPCGHMFHDFCLGVSHSKEGGWRGDRRGGGSGGTGNSAMCSLCSTGSTGSKR